MNLSPKAMLATMILGMVEWVIILFLWLSAMITRDVTTFLIGCAIVGVQLIMGAVALLSGKESSRDIASMYAVIGIPLIIASLFSSPEEVE